MNLKSFSALLLFLVFFSSLSITAQKKISLFNGKDLSGWVAYGTEKWYVEDGYLISESGPDKEYGYLATEKHYKNFELTLQFKQETDNGNSGVFIRSTIEGTKVSGWQVEVAPPNKHTGGIYESYGRGWLIKPAPEKESILKSGKWNKLKIRAVDGKITSWLNGVQMVTIDDKKIGEGNGSIALQIHSGGGILIKWRKLRLKKL
ncbi:DUF1080 domain-containing protein [Sabulilitoribacter arenilitoris]|uniref:DUF1080 domain-containing protein n=1 Tax=Wocania arenilitoris TaxID=2044858 RepID=A0AAE3JQN1_9FLAO|nr:DUF1080 domain-containing protein [Wocania arenilitoris]MCF7569365.1 DUF1080 domain-containing protein [Wocania arenilitoris]